MEDSFRKKLVEHVKKSLPGISDGLASKFLDADLSLRRLAHTWMTQTGIEMPRAKENGLQFESEYTANVIGPTLEFFVDRLGKFIAHWPKKRRSGIRAARHPSP